MHRTRLADPRRLYVAIDVVVGFASALGSATSVVYWVRDGHLDPLLVGLHLGGGADVVWWFAV